MRTWEYRVTLRLDDARQYYPPATPVKKGIGWELTRSCEMK